MERWSAQASVQTDQANLSSTGGIMAQALDGSDARTDKVATLQQAIATGSYNVSSSDVAEKMIDSFAGIIAGVTMTTDYRCGP